MSRSRSHDGLINEDAASLKMHMILTSWHQDPLSSGFATVGEETYSKGWEGYGGLALRGTYPRGALPYGRSAHGSIPLGHLLGCEAA